MKLRFLCATHRLELTQNTAWLINAWQNSFDNGQLLLDQSLLEEALPHLGCAFETAEMMMTTKAVEAQTASELFTDSAKLLAQTLQKQHYLKEGHDIFRFAIDRLNREFVDSPGKREDIRKHLGELHKAFYISQYINKPTVPMGKQLQKHRTRKHSVATAAIH